MAVASTNKPSDCLPQTLPLMAANKLTMLVLGHQLVSMRLPTFCPDAGTKRDESGTNDDAVRPADRNEDAKRAKHDSKEKQT